ncbi:hypothetical protein GmHk_15G044375 [Glycine max]|nr:hypothetical protein GmHk_15G044375 [Glycine max]
MASNSQQFSARSDAIIIRGVHEVATNSSGETKKLEGKLDALVNLVTQLAMNQKSAPVARLCGLCSSADHYTDLCPSEAIEQPEAYAANIYNRPPQPQQQNQPQQNNYDLSSNRYNLGWRNHPNLRWSNPSQQQQQQQPYFQNATGPSRPYNSDRLPSQSVQNPKNVSAIALRSGKQCQGPQLVASSSSANEPAHPHSTPEKDDDKNLKSKLPNNFYAGESKEK